VIGKVAVVVVLALSLQDGCGSVGPGSDAGGDSNPRTGECEINYAETVGGTRFSYPFFTRGSQGERIIVAKVIVRCGQPPETHHLVFELQRRRTGAGERWRQVKFRETSEIPRPVVTIYDQGHCDAGVTEIWRIYVKVTGTGVTESGERVPFEVEDYSEEKLIECPR
jgi:hypothetical protein